MNKTDKIYQKIKADLLLQPGSEVPTRSDLLARYGGASETLNKIVIKLEKEHIIRRISPRKFVISTPELNGSTPEGNIALVGFRGHLYGDYAELLIPRLFDRKLVPCVMPVTGSPLENKRLAAKFFNIDFEALIFNPFCFSDPEAINNCHVNTRIAVFDAGNKVDVPVNKILLDRSHSGYDALNKLFHAGYRVVEALVPHKHEPDAEERDMALTGIRKFQKLHPEMTIRTRYSLEQFHSHPKGVEEWARTLPHDTETIFCPADFDVILCRKALNEFTTLDYRRQFFIGFGNTDWAKYCPEPFVSYDCRLNDLVNMTLEILDDPPHKCQTRRVKPKIIYSELLSKYNKHQPM